MSGFYDIAVKKIDGSGDLLGGLRGKVTLAVNVASRCGLTPQYEGLEELQRELADQNFTVVGFPVQPVCGPGARQRRGDREFLPHHLWGELSAEREAGRERAGAQPGI